MKTPQSVSNLLAMPMDRKSFLKHIGVATLFAVGGNMIMQSIVSVSKTNSQGSTKGYGTSSYGQ